MHTMPPHITACTMVPAAAMTVEHDGDGNPHVFVPNSLLVNPEEVFEDLQDIGTPEEWALKCGGKRGHDRATCLAVANVIVRGSEHMPKIPPIWPLIREKFPNAPQPGPDWILNNVGPIGNPALYDHLFTFLGQSPFSSSEVPADTAALLLMLAFATIIRDRKEKQMEALLTGKGGGKHGASDGAPANPKGKGRGKAQEEKHPPEPSAKAAQPSSKGS